MIQVEPRKKVFPQKSNVEVIDIPKLSATEFMARRMRSGVTMLQLTMLTDIGRQRISRIEKGDTSSLIEDANGSFYVPRGLTMALMGIESGIYTK